MSVVAADATRAEALGPALTEFLLVVVAPQPHFRLLLWGNSAAVVGLLHFSWLARNLHLFNCRELVLDVLHWWGFTGEFSPWMMNDACDS